MKKYYFVSLFVFCLLLLASCSKKDYMTVIPADATFVAAVNLSDVAAEADLKNSPVMSLAKIGLMAAGQDQQLLREVLNDPSVIGIDFDAPAYVFQTPNHSWGLVLSVEDDSRLEDAFRELAKQQLVSKPIEKDGLMWTALLGDINVAFNQESLLILVSQQDGITAAMLKQHMKELFSQEQEESFAATEQMQQLEAAHAPVAIYSRMAALPQGVASSLAGFLPKGVRPANVEVCMSLTFNQGTASLKAQLSGKDQQTQQLLNGNSQHLRTLKGDFLGAASDNFFAWISMGCEGSWLLDLLKQNEDAKQALFMLERGIDIEQMLRSIDGDVTLVLPAEPSVSGLQHTDFMLLAQVEKTDFLSDVTDWTCSARDYGITLQSLGNQQYLLSAPELKLHWGVEQQTLYLATEQAYQQKAFSRNGSLLSAYKDEIEASQFFVLLNAQVIPALKDTALKSVVIKSEKSGELEVRFVGKQEDKSLLSQMLDTVFQFFSLPN